MIKFSVLFLCLSVYLSVCLSFSLTIPSVFFLSLFLSLPLSLFLSPPSLSVCLSIYLSPLRFDGSETLIRVLCLSSHHYHYGSIYVLLMGFSSSSSRIFGMFYPLVLQSSALHALSVCVIYFVFRNSEVGYVQGGKYLIVSCTEYFPSPGHI